MEQLKLTLIGSYKATTATDEPLKFATDKVRALFAYLAIEADRPHQRDSLATLLWPDQPDQQARRNLRLTLHRLKQALDGGSPALSDAVLTITRKTVQFHSATTAVDYHQFQSALNACENHSHIALESCALCQPRLEQAAELYAGELFPGFILESAEAFDEWLLIQREFLHQQALMLLGTLATMYEQQGAFDKALTYARRQLALEPWLESAQRQAMRALALSGQRNLALMQYEQCCHILDEQLGVEPTQETAVLFEQIKEGQLATIPARGQLHHFPTQTTPFVGRDEELATLIEQLQAPNCRMVTVIGPGGSGKTRLSIEVAQQVSKQSQLFTDGLFFVSLTAVAPTDVATTIADKLGLRSIDQEDGWRLLASNLQDQSLLLVLDNFEHVLSEAPHLANLLTVAPHIKLLVTSQAALNIHAEQRFSLRGLDYPPEAAVATASFGAVRLFVQAARQSVPNFVLDDESATAVARLCQLVDGLPLALEIAASWVRLMDCATIVQQTERNLDFLTSSWQDLPARHRSLRAVFEQSWQLLSDPLQLFLARVALFRGSFSLAAALAIVPDASMLDVATMLDKSLLKRTSNGRYQLHELLRQFITDKQATIAPPTLDLAQVQQAFSRYFLTRLIDATPDLQGQAPERALQLLQPNIDNLRQAWQWALAHQQTDLLLQAVAPLRRYYHLAGYFQEGERLCQQTLDQIEAAPSLTNLRYDLLVTLSHFLGLQGKYDAALDCTVTAVQLAESTNQQAWALSIQGEWLRHLGRLEEADAVLATAVATYQPPINPAQLAHTHSEIGFTRLRQAHHDEALTTFQQALTLYRQVGDKTAESDLLGNIGYVYFLKAKYDLALTHYEQALEIAETLNYKQGIVKHSIGLGNFHKEKNQFDAARHYLRRGLDLSLEIGYLRGRVNCLMTLGDTYLYENNLSASEQLYITALALAENANLRDLIGYILGKQGVLSARHGDYPTAIAYYEQAIAISQELNNAAEWGKHLTNLSATYIRLKQYDKALAFAQEGLVLARQVGNIKWKAHVLMNLGSITRLMGDYDQSLAYHQEALQIYRDVAHTDGVSKNVGFLGILNYEMGDFTSAIRYFSEALRLSESINDELTAGVWRLNLGKTYHLQGRHDAALEALQQAERLFATLQSKHYLGVTLVYLGAVYLAQAQYERARQSITEGGTLAQKLGDKRTAFEGQVFLAQLSWAEGEGATAVAHLHTLLTDTTDPADQAEIHLLLWEWGAGEDHRVTAVGLYDELLTKTPNSWHYQQNRARLL